MGKNFRIEIITPYRVFYSGPAEALIVNSIDGELGILADHEAFVTPIAIGAVRMLIDNIWKDAAFSDGFLEMEEGKLTVLVGAAEWPGEIDTERAERSLKRANERLGDKSMPWETQRATLAQKRALTRLQVAARAQKESA